MNTWRRLRRLLVRAVAVLVAIPLLLYIVLLSWHAYSSWQASRTLTQLEPMRLGTPESEYNNAVRGMQCTDTQRGRECFLVPGVYNIDRLVNFAWNRPSLLPLIEMAEKGGFEAGCYGRPPGSNTVP